MWPFISRLDFLILKMLMNFSGSYEAMEKLSLYVTSLGMTALMMAAFSLGFVAWSQCSFTSSGSADGIPGIPLSAFFHTWRCAGVMAEESGPSELAASPFSSSSMQTCSPSANSVQAAGFLSTGPSSAEHPPLLQRAACSQPACEPFR